MYFLILKKQNSQFIFTHQNEKPKFIQQKNKHFNLTHYANSSTIISR